MEKQKQKTCSLTCCKINKVKLTTIKSHKSLGVERQRTLHNMVTQPLRGENTYVEGTKGHNSTNITANLSLLCATQQ